MGIHLDIINAIATLLKNIKTANGYPIEIADTSVFTRDDKINVQTLVGQNRLPALEIGFAGQGVTNDRFTDTPRLFRANDVIPIAIYGVVQDARASSGESVTTQAASMIDSVKTAIGTHLKDSISSIYHVTVNEPQILNDWNSPYQELLFQVNVFTSYYQPSFIEFAPTVLSYPSDLSISIFGGQLTATFSLPPTAVGVNIWKNNEKIVSLNATGVWNDGAWHIGSASNFYAFEGEDASGNTVISPILQFPYYPSTAPELNHYAPIWNLATQPLAQFTLGDAAPEDLIENKIRQEIELLRINGGILAEDVNYTIAGQLQREHLMPSRIPLVQVVTQSVTPIRVDQSREERTANININVYATADRTDADRIDSPIRIRRILHKIRALALTADENVQNWGSIMQIDNTRIGATTYPQNAVQVGNELLFQGSLALNIDYKWNWRS